MTDLERPFAISDLLAAIEGTSSEMSAMNDRITALEATNYRLDEENARLRTDLADVMRRAEAAESSLHAATRGADFAEARAVAHKARVEQVQTELSAANDDLARISTAVSGLLGRRELRR